VVQNHDVGNTAHTSGWAQLNMSDDTVPVTVLMKGRTRTCTVHVTLRVLSARVFSTMTPTSMRLLDVLEYTSGVRRTTRRGVSAGVTEPY
jgi:hypothetical protein